MHQQSPKIKQDAETKNVNLYVYVYVSLIYE